MAGRHGMPRRTGRAGLVVMAAALAACATTEVDTDYDRRANFAQYRTFQLQEGRVLVNGVETEGDTLLTDRIEGYLRQGFAGKGLRPVAENADLIVTYTSGARNVMEVEPWDGYSYGWVTGFGDDAWVDEYQEGTLVIDVIDRRTNKLVWRGVTRTEADNLRSPAVIRNAVDEALDRYPPGAST